MAFTHLHLHTEYSLLDGACRIDALMRQAKEKGMNSIAITDHGVMYGVVAFYNAAKKYGIKPIIGCEVYVANRTRHDKVHEFDASSSHLVLLCKNNIGYQNLCKIVSLAFSEGYYYKPRIDKELLSKYSEGLIALSACLQGELSRLIISGMATEAENCALWYKKTFGENYFIEVQDHGIAEQKRVNIKLIEIAKRNNIKIVATNDVHYIDKSDYNMQKLLILVGTNKTVDDDDALTFETNEFYLKSEEEMEKLFPKEYIENTQAVADMCNVEFEFGNLKLPRFEIDGCENHNEFFRNKCFSGLKILFQKPEKEYIERLEYELEIIIKMGYVDYYLIVADFVNYAKQNDIPVGPGRGSGAASLCAYCIGITDVDPIKYNLLFERFLNPERVSMPDFDIDFCYVRRQEVIDYVIRRYGSDHVAQIVTFGTLAARAAVKDIGRAMAIPYSVVDNVSKLIPNDIHQTLENALNTSSQLKKLYESDLKIKELIDMAKRVEGMPRHASTHAAGVVITDKPVFEYVPLSLNDNSIVTQYTMTELEQIGLLKMDFLGLRNLTVIDDAQKMIRKENPEFDITKVSIDDKKVYKMLSAGLSEGVFQFESAGMRNTMMQLKPTSIEDLIALLSLYRPGPVKSIPKYIENKHNPNKIKYPTPLLKPILDVTYGCMVYQEQVMQVFRTLAGYSLGHADIIRRAMAKKKHDVLLKEKETFKEGCLKNGVDERTAEELFGEITAFSSYAFNKAHAAAYSVVSYRTAYLKCYYPAYYMASLLTSVLDRAGKIQEYIEECIKIGISVLPPHINSSMYNYVVENEDIRFGLLGIKNVGRTLVQNIITERKENGNYKNIYDFCKRCSSRELNRRALESLIKSGCFDNLGYNRREMLESSDDLISQISQSRFNNIEGQLDLFDTGKSSEGIELKHYEEFDNDTLLSFEKDVIGFYISGHPLSRYDKIAKENCFDKIININNSDSYTDGRKIKVLCFINSVKKKTTKKNELMAFCEIEDVSGMCEMLIFPKIFVSSSEMLSADKPYVVAGKVSVKDENTKQIICEKIEFIDRYFREPQKTLYLKIPSMNSIEFEKVKKLISSNSGVHPIIIYFSDTKRTVKSSFSFSESNIVELKSILGNENVILK